MGGLIPLDVTNRFVVDFARRHGGRVLDYGCGAGRSVTSGRGLGIDMYGTDVFYGGSETRRDAEATGLFGDRIREMSNDRIPFDDASFDLVTNNQVMEHVKDLYATLREIPRVLKPGGLCLSVFPSKDVWREGHIGIPFAHWLPKVHGFASSTRGRCDPRPRHMERTGADHTPVGHRQARLDRPLDPLPVPRRDLFYVQPLFRNELRERDYILYRLLDSPSPVRRMLARTVDWPLISHMQVPSSVNWPFW